MPEEVDPEAKLLVEVAEPAPTDRSHVPTPRPGISLRDSVLLTNGHGDLQIGTQLALEIRSADRIDLLSAFVRFAGIRLIRREIEEFLLRGGEMRVIASVYTGSTEKRALDELVGLGAKVKVSYETSQTRLHAKAWLFERNSGFHTAYVGSSNLTHSALLEGLEWNVRATAVDNPRIVARIAATFEHTGRSPSSSRTTRTSTATGFKPRWTPSEARVMRRPRFALASMSSRSRSSSRSLRL